MWIRLVLTGKWTGFKKRSNDGYSNGGPPDIMSVLSWNFRGLGNPRVVQFLQEIIFQKKSSIVFLCETLCKREKVEQVKSRMGYEGSFVVEARGHSGGISIIWRKQDEGKVLSYSINHIDMIFNLEGHPEFHMTGLYGEPDRNFRATTWRLIRQLNEASNLP